MATGEEGRSFNQALALVIAGGLITVVGPTVQTAVEAVLHNPPPISCSVEYQRYGQLREAYADAELVQPEDSDIERQCHINEFLKSIRKRPAQLNPGQSGKSP